MTRAGAAIVAYPWPPWPRRADGCDGPGRCDDRWPRGQGGAGAEPDPRRRDRGAGYCPWRFRLALRLARPDRMRSRRRAHRADLPARRAHEQYLRGRARLVALRRHRGPRSPAYGAARQHTRARDRDHRSGMPRALPASPPGSRPVRRFRRLRLLPNRGGARPPGRRLRPGVLDRRRGDGARAGAGGRAGPRPRPVSSPT